MSDGVRTPSATSCSSTSLSSLPTPLSDTCDGLGMSKTNRRIKCSPAVSLEDLLSNGSISPIFDHDGRIRRVVHEAQDACIWLKSAGFPQYVQKFETGEFPLNLTKLRVEKDHTFLDPPAIEALIKRLNILNRCADLLEEVLTKDDESEDEDDLRALSDQWQFQKTERRWSRTMINRTNSKISCNIPISPLDGNQSLLVSELSTSPSKLGGGLVKTYTFCLNNERDESPVSPIKDIVSVSSSNAKVKPRFSMGSFSGGEGDLHSSQDGLECLGSFASGMLDEFETTLSHLRNDAVISRSLPNIFASCLVPDDKVFDNRLSTNSDNSLLAKDDFLTEDDMSESPPVHSRGGSGEGDSGACCRSSTYSEATWGPSPNESLIEETGSTPEDKPHFHLIRRNTMGSTDTGSFLEQVELMEGHNSSLSQPIRAKWHSFQRQHSFRHVFKPLRTLIPIEELSVGQISVLRKLSLVKLTAQLELHNGKANVSRILKTRKHKQHSLRNKTIFGGNLATNVLKHGTALPPLILQAMDHLKATGMEKVGLFRRTAAKPRVESLRQQMETNADQVDFSEYSSYEIADVIKLYFRELPEPLLTTKLSEALLSSYECIPEEVRLQALQAIMLLLPDENREALQCLLYFLKYVASQKNSHQMDMKNLSVCLAPTLFALSTIPRPSPLTRRGSLKRSNATNSQNLLTVGGNKEVNEHVLSSKCLTELIQHYDKLFTVAADMMQVCKFSHLEFGDPVPYHDLGRDKNGHGSYKDYIDECMTTLAKDQRKKYRGWVQCNAVKDVELAYSKVGDGIPLKLWRGTTEIPVPPYVVLQRLWEEKHLWDGRIVKGRQVAQLDPHTEVFQYVTSSVPPLTHRDHCVLRSWKFDPSTESYVIVSTSVSHPHATLLAGVRCTELAMRYLIEKTADGNSQLSLYCRVDMRGRSPEFYNHAFGRYLASSIHRIRDSFKRSLQLEYLETPV